MDSSHKTAYDALDNIGNMADEMEQRYEKLEFEKECYMNEMESLVESKHQIESEVKELNDIIDNMVIQTRQLEDELLDARTSFTGLQLAVSILIFVYGLIYGKYLCN